MSDIEQFSKLRYMNTKIQLESLVVNFQELTITTPNQDNSTALRLKEAELLALLCYSYPEVLNRSMIIEELWSASYATDLSVNQLINSVRRKLGPQNKLIVKTVPKVGYKLQIEPIVLSEHYEKSEQNTKLTNMQIAHSNVQSKKNVQHKQPKRVLINKFRVLCLAALLAGITYGKYKHNFPFNRLHQVNGISFTFIPNEAQLEKVNSINKSSLFFVDKIDGDLYSCLRSYVCKKL